MRLKLTNFLYQCLYFKAFLSILFISYVAFLFPLQYMAPLDLLYV
jgi:hypothetical protein